MLKLDIQTLLVATMASLVGLSIAMPLIMGRRVSRPARYSQAAVLLQTLAWACVLLSSLGWNRALSTLGMACMSTGLVCQWRALEGWLGPRPGRLAMGALAVLMPLGYGAGFESYAFRVGWSNFGLAGQMVLICLALAWPAPQANKRWRVLMGVCMAALGGVTAARGVLGAFFTEAYPYFTAPHPVNLASALIQNVSVVLSTLGLMVAWREETERALQRQATTDSLTGLLNRRAFTERALAAHASARRHGHALSLLLLDLDAFKKINDEHGHAFGDEVLRLLGRVLTDQLRPDDLAARHGGEEFCVLLAHTDADSAGAFDDRLRERLRLASQQALGLPVAYSAGLAEWPPEGVTLDELLRRADGAMYRAKGEGRNRRARA